MGYFNLKKGFLFLLIICILLIGLFYFIEFNNTFVEVNTHDMVNFLNNENEDKEIYIYVGRPTCINCKILEPILKNYLKNLNKTIYYYNIDNAIIEDEEEMKHILSLLDIYVVPTIVYLQNGNLKDKIVGIQDEQKLSNFFQFY